MTYNAVMHRLWWMGLLLTLVALSAGCGSSDGQTTEPLSAVTSTAIPVHWQLATIHVERGGAGQIPLGTSGTVLSLQFRFVLDQLVRKCGSTPTKIGDMTVKGQDMLLERGVKYSLVDLMEDFNRAAVGNSTEEICVETLALLVTLLSR